MAWQNTDSLNSSKYTCGHCGSVVATGRGYNGQKLGVIRICPHCEGPTHFVDSRQIPGVAPGAEVGNVPSEVDALYREARKCIAASSYTASVLTCRKLLMHVAVAEGAEVGQSFVAYVDYLAAQGYVPPNGRGWVDHIRRKSNEANHEIVVMSKQDAEELVTFAEMLLKFMYEFPSRIPTSPSSS